MPRPAPVTRATLSFSLKQPPCRSEPEGQPRPRRVSLLRTHYSARRVSRIQIFSIIDNSVSVALRGGVPSIPLGISSILSRESSARATLARGAYGRCGFRLEPGRNPRSRSTRKSAASASTAGAPRSRGGSGRRPDVPRRKKCPESCLGPSGGSSERTIGTHGHAPASPIPNRNRTSSIVTWLNAAPVAMVKADQVKVPHDVRRKLRDGDAIEVGDHRQEDRQPDDLVADAAGGEGRGTIEHGRRRSRWVGQLRPIAHYVSLAPDNRFFSG